MRRGAAWYDADTASGTDKPAAVHFTSREERIYSMPLKTRLAPKEHMGLTTRQKIKKYRAFYIMFIPLFLCLVLFSYLPMFGILYAFTDYTPFKPASFVGLQNFQKLFSQAGFWKAFFNTLQISITKLIIDTVGSIVLALLLDELHFKWFKKISQTIIYIPHFMSWVVVASIFTMFLSPKNGLINGVITALGGDSIYFLANEKWWRPIFYMIAVWKDIGWGTIIYIAALSGVDMEQHEAAVLDGATRFQRVIYLTLPAISGTIVTVFILNMT
jgi:putative aldouronate transport system permease protein